MFNQDSHISNNNAPSVGPPFIIIPAIFRYPFNPDGRVTHVNVRRAKGRLCHPGIRIINPLIESQAN